MSLGGVHVVESSPLFAARFLLLFVKSDFLLALKRFYYIGAMGATNYHFFHFYDLSAGCGGAQR